MPTQATKVVNQENRVFGTHLYDKFAALSHRSEVMLESVC